MNVPLRTRIRQRGSALIEAAAVLPFFAVLLCASVDIARTFHLCQVTAAAARAGIHRALVEDPHTLDLQAVEAAAAADAGQPGFTARASRVCACSANAALTACEASPCAPAGNSYVRVEAGVELTLLLYYPWMTSPSHVRSEALVRVE